MNQQAKTQATKQTHQPTAKRTESKQTNEPTKKQSNKQTNKQANKQTGTHTGDIVFSWPTSYVRHAIQNNLRPRWHRTLNLKHPTRPLGYARSGWGTITMEKRERESKQAKANREVS